MNQRLVIMIGILALSGTVNAEEPANKPAASSTEDVAKPVEKKRDDPGTMTFELCQRKLLNKSYEGFYVQDFYLEGEKFTDPYLIKEEKDFTSGDCSKAIAKKGEEGNFSLDYTNYASIMPSIKGPLVRWHKNQTLYSREIYENGGIQGLQETKFDNGQVEFRANHINGLFNGEVAFMDRKGDKKSRSFYKNSKRDGLSITWFDDGKTRVEVKYIDGVLQENYASFYTSNDQKKAQGKINKQQQKTDFWQYWYENGQKEAQGNFIDEKKAGEWVVWHQTGEKRSEGSYKEDKEVGMWSYWYENGQLSQKGAFNDQGKQEGQWTYWHNNGAKDQEGTYVNGEIGEDWKAWDDRGEPLRFIKAKKPEDTSPIESEEALVIP